MLEIFSAVALNDRAFFLPEIKTEVVVILAGPRRAEHPQGILTSCIITEQTDRYLEITCAD